MTNLLKKVALRKGFDFCYFCGQVLFDVFINTFSGFYLTTFESIEGGVLDENKVSVVVQLYFNEETFAKQSSKGKADGFHMQNILWCWKWKQQWVYLANTINSFWTNYQQ